MNIKIHTKMQCTVCQLSILHCIVLHSSANTHLGHIFYHYANLPHMHLHHLYLICKIYNVMFELEYSIIKLIIIVLNILK